MRAYSFTTRLKLGLILAAVAIAVISITYTNKLVEKLREREQTVIELWASALEQIPKASLTSENPYQLELTGMLRALDSGSLSDTVDVERYKAAIRWAQGMPPSADLSFILDDVLRSDLFDIPAIVTDDQGNPQYGNNLMLRGRSVSLPDSAGASLQDILALRDEMKAQYEPITIDHASAEITPQRVYYGDSRLVKQLRFFPFAQLLFGSLFILVGYTGFSYVRRSEQSNLWVGMAKEAAHQLGTPISSLMGWIELLRNSEVDRQQIDLALDELEVDVSRLSRVASRFSDIGSMPKLTIENVGTVVGGTINYMSKRIPQKEGRVNLTVDIPDDIEAPLNCELFEWVVENLIKNSLDAMENRGGTIALVANRLDGRVQIDVSDSGKGIERSQWKNVFRPGYSTKKRGWGLGLSLAKRIVEDYHGGSLILLRSRPGAGTTFRIELPAA
ncbi:MAG: HAMP domain-containing sensor histidine kinase [Rhodothermales bacterium]